MPATNNLRKCDRAIPSASKVVHDAVLDDGDGLPVPDWTMQYVTQPPATVIGLDNIIAILHVVIDCLKGQESEGLIVLTHHTGNPIC